MDDPEVEKIYKRIISAIPSMQNGLTAYSLEKRGVKYEKNYGVSIVDLKKYSSQFEKNHLLALKLWNKKWRETMILATLLDEPKKVNEEQMDFWIKTSENTEIIEQAVTNLLTETPFAFVKALEWCRGKKYHVKFCGLLMMGRMALTSKNDIDEMFDSFFDVIPPLSKDASLYNVFFRSVCQLARRSKYMNEQCVSLAKTIQNYNENNAQKLGDEIIQEILSPHFQMLIKK